MTVKRSISLTDQIDEFARKLVEEGRFASLSAVVQHSLATVKAEMEKEDAELEAFKEMMLRRSNGPFIPLDEFMGRVEKMIAERRREVELDN